MPVFSFVGKEKIIYFFFALQSVKKKRRLTACAFFIGFSYRVRIPLTS